MASQSYFDTVPNFNYPNPTVAGGRNDQYVEVKNLFLRLKFSDEAIKSATSFSHYSILENERPDNVAEKLYNNPNLDWVLLIGADIVNVRDEWPLSNRLLYDYAEEKYGTALNETRHFETKEVRDSKGRLLLPANMIVDSGFTIPNPEIPNQKIDPTVGVSNWLVEVRKNNEKRTLRYLKPEYISTLLDDVNDFMNYQESSQFSADSGKTASYTYGVA